MLLVKHEIFPIPHILGVASFSYHMDMYRFMVMAEK